jgi:hypothetical protein
MNAPKIETVEDLKDFLGLALKLEHATIPPYLTALYSIRPGTNSDAWHIIRVVAVEEMLHLTLAANMLNAIGGAPDLTGDDFVADYPARLSDGETDFWVNLERFSESAVDTFLMIERPKRPQPGAAPRALVERRVTNPACELLKVSRETPQVQFYSIGEFYAEIGRGFNTLHEKLGPGLFAGDPNRQVTAGYYYSGGGALFPITNIEGAREAVRLIAEQGEGYDGGIFNRDNELAHYYRFQQLKFKRYYLPGDKPDHPTGPPLNVDFSAVYPIKTNAGFNDYPKGSELYTAAVEFANDYRQFRALITQAYTGRPELLQAAVARMFALKEQAITIIRNPIPGSDGVNAAPTFAPPRGQS